MQPLSRRIATRLARHIAKVDAFEQYGISRDEIPMMEAEFEPIIQPLLAEAEAVAVVEVFFRGKWTSIGEVKSYAAESGWDFPVSEPISQIRVVYKK